MPRLACWRCGRQVYSEEPLDRLLAGEPRCPRCGAYLNPERRVTERRQTEGGVTEGHVTERRSGEDRRRAPGDASGGQAAGGPGG